MAVREYTFSAHDGTVLPGPVQQAMAIDMTEDLRQLAGRHLAEGAEPSIVLDVMINFYCELLGAWSTDPAAAAGRAAAALPSMVARKAARARGVDGRDKPDHDGNGGGGA